MTDKTLAAAAWSRAAGLPQGRRQRRRACRRAASRCRRGAGQEAHLLGRTDLLRGRQQAPDRDHQRLGRRQRRRDRSGDDQPERDRAEGLGRRRLQHHARCARSRPRSAAAAVAAGRVHHPRRSLQEGRRSPGRLVRGVDAATDTTEIAGGRTGMPFGVNGNLLLRRKDLLEPAGFTEAPKTWEELSLRPSPSTSRRSPASVSPSPTSATPTCRRR